jgi:uncharacterized protein YqjF (DUF2071 family)
MPGNEAIQHSFEKTNWRYTEEYTIWDFYKKVTRHRTATNQWVTLRERIIFHISNHQRDKYWRSTDRKKVQLENTCRKHRTQACGVMNKEDKKQVFDTNS